MTNPNREMQPAVLTERHGGVLVNRICGPGEALSTALDLARAILRNAPLAVRMTKQIMTESASWPAAEVWDRQRALVEGVLATEDAREGALAFSEKRPPRWQGS